MKASEIKTLVKSCYENRKPKLFIVGPPGCGKSSVTYQVFQEELKVPLYVLQAMLYDPIEVKGLPVYQNGKAKFVPFEEMATGDEGALFIDDLVHAPQQTQNALMRLILENKCGSWDLGNLFPIAAGNRATDRAGAKDMQTALANRFVRIEFTVDYDEWRPWAIRKHIAPEVVSYLGTPYGRDWLDKFDASKQINPTPRSWEFASDLIKAQTIKGGIIRECLYGAIGEEATAKFMGYLKVYDKLPDLKTILDGKNIFPKEDELDIMYAVVSGLVNIAASFEKRKTVFQRLIAYACAMPDTFRELGVWLAKDLYQLDSTAFLNCNNLADWQKSYSDVVL